MKKAAAAKVPAKKAIATRERSPLPLEYGGPVEVLNFTNVDVQAIAEHNRAVLGPLADAMMEWHRRVTNVPRRGGSLVQRDRFLMPATYYDKVRTARHALSDDIVGGAADGTEAIALRGTSIACADREQQDIWNQIVGNEDDGGFNLDDTIRKMWRGLFSDSAFVAAVWWGRASFKVRGKTGTGRAARKTFDDLIVPQAVSMLDTTRIVPVGSLTFGQERLCYMADGWEAFRWDAILTRRDQIRALPPAERDEAMTALYGDPELEPMFLGTDFVSRFVVGRYTPDMWERRELLDDGVEDVTNLFQLDPNAVFRHTLTRPDYRRFPDCRLASVFPLLDIKNQLQSSDRAHLVGGANMIIVATQGEKENPATQPELQNLREGMRVLAQMPVVVGPHHLKIEIVTPDLDTTLDRDKWDTADVRLAARTWGTFVPTGEGQDDPIKLGRVIGQGLESRRHMLARAISRWILLRCYRLNEKLTERPKLLYTPRQIVLSFDSAQAQFVENARAAGEVSRRTYLGVVDADQDDEAMFLEQEHEEYDAIFKTDWAPNNQAGQEAAGAPSSPQQQQLVTRRGGAQQGGNKGGGGRAPANTNQGGRNSAERQPKRGGGRQRPAGEDQ